LAAVFFFFLLVMTMQLATFSPHQVHHFFVNWSQKYSKVRSIFSIS
jgi:hypothetical protein